MSALDDLVTYNGHLTEEEHAEARAELELLRSEVFKAINFFIIERQNRLCVSKQQAITDNERIVLSRDPERARRMGLGWAL